MRTASVGQRAMALSLVFILVSCSATRPSVAGPTGPQDLDKYAILFETQPDGTVTHTWRPVAEIDLTQYQYRWGANRVEGPIEQAVMSDEEIADACDRVMRTCMDECMKDNYLPGNMGHIRSRIPKSPSRAGKAKYVYCSETCAEKRTQCYSELRKRRQEAVEFSSAERAIEWIKRHKVELLVGSIVIIAAVAFVVVACGSGGCVVLIPILVVADNIPPSAPHLASPVVAEMCQ